MAKEITITLDAAKLRDLVSKRSYTNKEGQGVEVQEVKFKLVEMKEPKNVHSTDKFNLVKTHFACKIQTKEERDAGKETEYIGEGVSVVWKNEGQNASDDSGSGLPF